MKVTLEESKLRQRDHKERCEQLVNSGVVINSAENEDKSYKKLFEGVLLSFPLAKKKEIKVLDVGCQYGVAYSKVLHELDYYGIEVLEEVAEKATALGIPNVSVGFMEELDRVYEPGTFDVVWARHVLEHSSDFEKVMAQVSKVLKPDGVLAFIVPCGFHNEPAHITEHERDDWRKVISDAGFTIDIEWQHDFNLNEYCGIAHKKSAII